MRGEQEVETIEPWLQNILARAPGCPVIIVGTHLDLLSKGWCGGGFYMA